MENAEYCMACLVTDVKMHRFSSTELTSTIGKAALHFLRMPVTSNNKRENSYFCFECAAFLYKYEKFRTKCEKAQDVLSQLKKQYNKITKTVLHNVNRYQHNLVSTLTKNPTECISSDDPENIDNSVESTALDLKPNPDNCTKNEITLKNEITEETPSDHYENDINFDNYDEININTKDPPLKIIQTIKKEYKTRKRKAPPSDSLSDDEPLINKASKPSPASMPKEVVIIPRKSFNSSYFEDYATVEFLTQDDAKKELLLRKESSNYINSPFKCEFCYRGFESKGTFENHMIKHSSDIGEYKCDICHLRFKEQRRLCKHRLASHKRKFSCKLCPYVCYCMYQAKTHVCLHKGKKYPCKECEEVFSMPNSLQMHKRLKHVTESVWCVICGDMFASPRGLNSHQVKVHRQENVKKSGPKCEECNIHFASEEAWKRHLVLSSKHYVSNGCKNCGATFSNEGDLKRHVRIHARKTKRRPMLKLPSACVICEKRMVDRSEYKKHLTSQHPDSDIAKKLGAEEITLFVCELCGLTFKTQYFLRYHQRKHTGERPHACAQCGRTFHDPRALASHRAEHRARRHACRLCHRVFNFKSGLNKHMKMHLNIRPHRCDICDKSFINPCDVRIHVKYVHNKQPWPKRNRNKKNQDTEQ